MIPILYETNETEFTSLGIGPLGDAIDCVVTEELNGEYELEMTYPVNGIHYSDLVEDRLIYAVPFEGGSKQIFKIYQIEKPLNGKVVVRAEHIHYLLNKMVVKPFKATTPAEAMVKLKPNVIDYCPFNFTTDMTSTGTLDMIVPMECGKLLGGTTGSILDAFGHGEYEFNNFNVILKAHRGTDNGVTIRYGKNMTELNAKVDTTNVYTGIVPYYKDTENNVTFADGYAVWSNHKADYTYPLAKVVDMSSEFDAERDAWQQAHSDSSETYHPSSADLITKAQAYLEKNAGWNKLSNIKVSFVNLWQTDEYSDIAVLERVKMGDTVTVIYQKLGVKVTTKVIKTEYNVLLDRYDSIELGAASSSLASEVANTALAIDTATKEQKSWMEEAIEHATKLISGGLGGYVVLNRNAAGKPNEILIMDTPDKSKAVNVWRFNLNGLGHSHSGYNGPFDDVALTMDGHINANMITVGELRANIIKAGILSDKASLNYWNMETGEFRLVGTAKIGDSTVASKKDVSNGDSTTLSTANSNAQTYANDALNTANANAKEYANVALAEANSNAQGYANSALTQANTNIAGAISNYDSALNQLKIFNKLTNNGETQGIYLTDNKLYVNAEFIKTGILYGETRDGNTGAITKSFALNMNTGDITMHNGAFSGNIAASTIDGGVITGAIVQSAHEGNRIAMDGTSSLKGLYNNELHNIINMSNRNNTNNDMIIDADHSLHIRTPKIYVAEQSYGSGGGNVYETLSKVGTGEYENGFKVVTNVAKRYDYHDSFDEHFVKDDYEDYDVLCVLPVLMTVDYAKYSIRNGLWTTENRTWSDRI